MSIAYRKLAYRAEIRAQGAEKRVGKLADRVAELERAIADHRRGVLEEQNWNDEGLWRVLPRAMKAGRGT